MAAYFIEVLIENQSNKPISYDIMRKDGVGEMLAWSASAYKPSELVDTEAQTDRRYATLGLMCCSGGICKSREESGREARSGQATETLTWSQQVFCTLFMSGVSGVAVL